MNDSAEPMPPCAPASSSHNPATEEILATVEAILFATDTPLTPAKIAKAAELSGSKNIKEAVAALNARYEQIGSAFRIEEIAGGYQMLTLPQYHDVLKRLLQTRRDSRLSQAALETLAIIAYRQPILRADIEAIRGVACGEVLRSLMEKQLVKIVGRAEVIGRPMLYGTTKRFLEVFGISKLEDLPRVEELRGGAKAKPPEAPPAEAAPADPAAAAPTVAPAATPARNKQEEVEDQEAPDEELTDDDLDEEELDDEDLDDEDLEEDLEDDEEEFEEEDGDEEEEKEDK